MKKYIKKLSLNLVLVTSLLVTASCKDKKDNEALKAAEAAKDKFIEHTTKGGFISLVVDLLGSTPLVGREHFEEIKDKHSVEELKKKLADNTDIYLNNSGYKVSTKDGIGIFSVKEPSLVFDVNKTLEKSKHIPPNFTSVTYRYPDINFYIDPNNKSEVEFSSNGLVSFLVKDLKEFEDKNSYVEAIIGKFIPKTEDGHYRLYATGGNTKGKLIYNEDFHDEYGLFFPFSLESKTKDYKFLVTSGNVPLFKIDNSSSYYGISKHDKNRTIGQVKTQINGLQIGDILKAVVGNVKPINFYLDIEADIDYEVKSKAGEQVSKPVFKALDLDFNKIKLETNGSVISMQGVLKVTENEESAEVKSNVFFEYDVNITNYKSLVQYVGGFIPNANLDLFNKKLDNIVTKLLAKDGEKDLKLKVVFYDKDSFTINGISKDKFKEIVADYNLN